MLLSLHNFMLRCQGRSNRILFFFSSRRRHTRSYGDWSSDVCSSDLLFRLLLVAVVLELFLANGLLDFFRGQGGQCSALRTATVPHPLAALAPSPRGRGLESSAHRTHGPALAVALVPLAVALVPLRVALAARVTRLVLELLSAPPLRFGLRAVVARARLE